MNFRFDAMKDEMEFMVKNQDWDLIELPQGHSTIGCKWIYKTEKDVYGNIE